MHLPVKTGLPTMFMYAVTANNNNYIMTIQSLLFNSYTQKASTQRDSTSVSAYRYTIMYVIAIIIIL